MDQESSKRTDNRDVEAFIALQILGAILFVFITITAFVTQRRSGSRHPTFFSFCFSWIVFCISYALLTFAGQQNAPDHNLCNTQSALIYASPPLATSATVCLVTHLLLKVQLAVSNSRTAERRRLLSVSIALVIIPWIVWITIFIGIFLFGFRHPKLVQLSPNQTYCTLTGTSLPKLTPIWASLSVLILIAEEVVIGVLLYRNREVFRSLSQSVATAIRVVIITILGISGVILALVYSVTTRCQRGVHYDLLIGAIAPGAAVIFGTQKDLLQVWVFWKKFEDVSSRRTANHTDIMSTRLSTFSIPEAESCGAASHVV